ncbi:MAG: SLC26A/SulP transporter family protein [Burkholderiaceae bacterium]
MSAVDAQVSWLGSLWRRGGVARGDIAGGITAAVVLLAVEGAYGLVAFSRLGPEQAQLGFVLGVFAAAVSSIVTVVTGARGPMLSGSSAALALLFATLIGTLALDPRSLGPNGFPFAPLVLAFAALAVVLAGFLQLLLGVTRMAGLIRYVPYPVHAGYMNGTAILLVGAMLPNILGLQPGLAVGAWQDMKPLAPIVAMVAFLVAIRPPSWTRRIPAYMTAIAAATLLHHVLSLTPAQSWLGPLFAPPEFQWPRLDVLQPTSRYLPEGYFMDNIWTVLQFAVVMAFIAGLQTALGASHVDEMTHRRRSLSREMVAQGTANMAVGVIGGIPAAGAIMRSKVNIDAGGSTEFSRLFFGIGLVLALLIGLAWMRIVPMAAIAGVFSAVAYSLVDKWTRRATGVLWRQSLKWRVPRAMAQSYAIMVLVAAIAIFISLPAAIGSGMLVAILMFIRSNSKKPVRQVLHADVRRSRKIRPAVETNLLAQHGNRIVVVELDGALFFGTAEEADEAIEKLIHEADHIIIDFERVSEVDASGARVMLVAADHVKRAGKGLLLAGLSAKDGRTRTIRDMDVHGLLDDSMFFQDADLALEYAEDRLLKSLLPAGSATAALSLDETLMGSGLTSEERALLAAMLIERRITKGEYVFRSGDPGDSMYVLMHGQIGIWLPPKHGGDTLTEGRRLVSYAPGVVFGEMALLAGMARSADAIAEADALVLDLPRTQYNRLMADHPALLGKLLLNISLLLASRVRALSEELQAARAAH